MIGQGNGQRVYTTEDKKWVIKKAYNFQGKFEQNQFMQFCEIWSEIVAKSEKVGNDIKQEKLLCDPEPFYDIINIFLRIKISKELYEEKQKICKIGWIMQDNYESWIKNLSKHCQWGINDAGEYKMYDFG